MLITDLNTKVLLDVFGYLNVIDSINLAETCVHLREVAKLHYEIKYKAFNLCVFLKDTRSVFKDANSMTVLLKVFSHIGPYISHLNADLKGYQYGFYLSKIIQKYCVNVKTLQVYGYESEYSKWIENLKLETIEGNRNLLKEKLCHVTHNLNKMAIEFDDSDIDDSDDIVTELYYVLEQHPNFESLHIPLSSQFNYAIFAKLKKLEDLGIDIRNIKDLAKLTHNLKMNELKKFDLDIWFADNPDTNELNDFLKTLAENSNLEQLSLSMCDTIEESTLRTLKLFKLNSLKLTAPLDHDYILWRVQPNLTHLDLDLRCWDQCTLDKIISLIGKLKKLKIFHLWMDPKDKMKNQLLDEEVIKGILKMSKDRPKLELCIHLYDSDDAYEYIGVQFFFNRCDHKIIKIGDSSDRCVQPLVPCCYGH